MEYVELNNGVKMPILNFGVYQIPQAETKEAVLNAIKIGYRGIDTAQSYFNEKEVGDAIRECGIPREELFITTKIWIDNYGYEKCKKSVEESLKKLGTDYIDLVLLHQPFADYYGAYRALEELYENGKIKAIGVSNFYPDRLADMCLFERKVVPAVNQIETNPMNSRFKDQEVALKYGTKIMAWAPFGEGRNNMFTNETLVEIGKKYNKSAAQVILRWLIQRGVAISTLKNDDDCWHFNCKPNFLKSKNFYRDIEMLSKADPAQYGFWVLEEDARFVDSECVSGKADPDYIDNLSKINQIDDKFVMHYVSLLMNPSFINSPYKDFDLELLQTVSSKPIFSDLYRLMLNRYSLHGSHHKNDAIFLSQTSSNDVRNLLLEKAVDKYSLKSNNHEYDMKYISGLNLDLINKKIYNEMYFYLFSQQGIDDRQHKEKLEKLLQGILVERSTSLSSYLDYLQDQIENSEKDSPQIIESSTSDDYEQRPKIFSLLKKYIKKQR